MLWITTIRRWLFLSVFLITFSNAYANEEEHPHVTPSQVPAKAVISSQAPCGILEGVSGDVQILDSTKTHMMDATLRAVLPCGSWLSVGKGWARVRHQNGPYVHLGAQTFVQFPDFRQDKQFRDEHVVLFKGMIYAQAGNGEEEFRMVSPAGRARVNRGKVVFLFDAEQDQTQLIALEKNATLENRFEPSRKVTVQAGEATFLNFKLLRVIPSLPQAVSVASLRPRLAELRVGSHDQYEAIRAAMNRQSRKFAAPLNEGGEHDSQPKRSPASARSRGSYLRHQPSPDDARLRSYLVKKVSGGSDAGASILYPGKSSGEGKSVHVKFEDPAEKFNLKIEKKEEVEKQRLIEELSRIQPE